MQPLEKIQIETSDVSCLYLPYLQISAAWNHWVTENGFQYLGVFLLT